MITRPPHASSPVAAVSPLLQWHALSSSDRIAVRDDEGGHAYRDLYGRSVSAARELLGERDSLHGERVALLIEPGAAFVASFFGVLLAGGTVVILSPLHPAAETAYFCDDAHVNAIIASEALAPTLETIRLGRRVLTPASEAPQAPVSLPLVHGEQDALQLYTSGTTGKPKGAVLSHANIATQQELLRNAWGWSTGDTLLHALPLHHMHGLAIALLSALGAGAAVRFHPFDAPALWNAMSEASVFMAVPTMYAKLFHAFEGTDDATRARWTAHARALRLATSGSAALPVSLAEKWKALTGTIPLERFGMTEIGVGISNPLEGERTPGAVGFPLATVETRIVDDEGKDAESGELWIRGPSVFSRYHERPEETAKAFVPAGDGSPWFRTGDTVVRDPSREGAPFRILGRTSVDILKSGGYKLSALEIEEVLREHAAVAEVAVIGLPDETWGERVIGCVVPASNATATSDEIRTFCKSKLAAYKVPKEILFFSELPRNALGKVVKPELSRLVKTQRVP